MGSSPSSGTFTSSKHRNYIKQSQQQRQEEQKRRYIQQQLPLEPEDFRTLKEMMKKHCLFCHLSEQLKDTFLAQVKKWKYHSGHYIYRQNDVSASLYFIKDGGVYFEVYCDIITTLSQGEYFGHDSLCFDDPRSESIRVASKEVILYELKKEHVTENFKRYMKTYRQEIDSILEKVHFFNYLTNKEKQIIIENTFLFRMSKDEKIFQKDQNANSFFIIKKGTVRIQIPGKQGLIMKQGDYFGESAFFILDRNRSKSQRMGRALANSQDTELYGIGLSKVREDLDEQIRSIIFFNQEKWTLYRDPVLATFKTFDCNYLLQLFNVREAKKFTILAKKQTKPEYLFIPLQAQINTNRALKLYCSQFLKDENENELTTQDIVLTQNGYYAYALISEFKQVLKKNTLTVKQKRQSNSYLSKDPLYKVLSLNLRNISQYSKKLPSSLYSTVLIVQDMKFGNQIVVKIYKRKKRGERKHSLNEEQFKDQNILYPRSLKNSKTFASRNDLVTVKQTLRSINTRRNLDKKANELNGELSKLQVDDSLVKRQKQIISSLNCPLVCGYYKAQQDENHFYLFLEYVKGLNLDEIMIDFGMIPQSIIKYILASVVLFLDHLHSKNIVYRNLNPSNILIKNSGYLVMTDFSCAKRLDPLGRTNTVAGVPYYMAPQVVRQEQYGLNVDMWSLGIVLYEMLSGSLPFGEKAKQILQIYDSILNDELNFRKIRSKSQKILIKALLDKNPATRVQTAMSVRNFSYINDIEFDWPQLITNRMKPFYYPIKKSMNYKNFNNYEIFDASAVVDWD